MVSLWNFFWEGLTFHKTSRNQKVISTLLRRIIRAEVSLATFGQDFKPKKSLDYPNADILPIKRKLFLAIHLFLLLLHIRNPKFSNVEENILKKHTKKAQISVSSHIKKNLFKVDELIVFFSWETKKYAYLSPCTLLHA